MRNLTWKYVHLFLGKKRDQNQTNHLQVSAPFGFFFFKKKSVSA